MRAGLLGSLVAAVVLTAGLQAQESFPPAHVVLSADELAELKRRANAAYRQQDYPATVQLASRVLAADPKDAAASYLRASARVELGIAGEDAGLIRQGVSDARRAIEADRAANPDYYLPYLYGMSHLAEFEGQKENAETALREALKLLNRDGLALGTRGNLLYQCGVARTKLGDYPSAADDFRQALELAPDHFAARLALANVYTQTREFTAAEQEYSAAIQQFPTNATAYNSRGLFYQSQQRNNEAIADFTQAISLRPNDVQAILNRGYTRLNAGDYQAAEADFTRVLTLKPDHAPAYSLRATSAMLQSKVHQALEDYRKVIELRPSYAPARADMAFAYFFAEQYDTAAQAFEQAMILSPDAEYLTPWRYASLSLAGRDDAARNAYRLIVQIPAEERTWFDQLTLYLMGHLQERDLLVSIESRDHQLRDAQLCEAYYFIGLRMQRDGVGDPARYFRRALQARTPQLSAFRAAQFELNRKRQ
jgi:tetratricopeptide (TPR) repeat protein